MHMHNGINTPWLYIATMVTVHTYVATLVNFAAESKQC